MLRDVFKLCSKQIHFYIVVVVAVFDVIGKFISVLVMCSELLHIVGVVHVVVVADVHVVVVVVVVDREIQGRFESDPRINMRDKESRRSASKRFGCFTNSTLRSAFLDSVQCN